LALAILTGDLTAGNDIWIANPGYPPVSPKRSISVQGSELMIPLGEIVIFLAAYSVDETGSLVLPQAPWPHSLKFFSHFGDGEIPLM
jgi:hypothetical protein